MSKPTDSADGSEAEHIGSPQNVPQSVECDDGHGADWILVWGGGRADYICVRCQAFFNGGAE